MLSKVLLRGDKLARTRWFIYMILSDYREFEENYMRAWSEQPSEEKTIAIFLGDDQLITPMLKGSHNDRILLMQMGMFYRLLKIRRGLSELILPKFLVRMDWVNVSSTVNSLL
jgi:hypothetical protein